MLPIRKYHSDNIRVCVKSSFVSLLLCFFFLYLLSFSAFSPDQYWPSSDCPSCTVPLVAPASEAPTNISHLFFGIGGSAVTWSSRRHYCNLWWRPGITRGLVWFDEEPPDETADEDPPFKVSRNASRFGLRTPPARIARIVGEAYRTVVDMGSGVGEVRWFVMGDDDTVFFTENLVAVLGKYDHREMYYVGGTSESVEQNVLHSYGMAFGGGGFAISWQAAAELSRVLDGCLLQYSSFYGSDERVHACLAEIGVPLTRELGFHQMDIRGDPYGMLAAHPVAPLVTLHHLDNIDSILPGSAQLDALKKLITAASADPPRTLQQTIAYDTTRNWSISVSWGYTVQIYASVLPPHSLLTPLRTFQTWRSFEDGPFLFNTRPLSADPCQRPLVFLFDRVNSKSVGTTVTEYAKHVAWEKEERCVLKRFVEASKIGTVQVTAPKMNAEDWKRAPRKQCCQVVDGPWWVKRHKLQLRIRKCRSGDVPSLSA